MGVAADTRGNIYIADSANHRVRKIGPDGRIATIAGTGVVGFSGDEGPAAAARLNSPFGVAVDAEGNVYIADRNNQRIRKLTPGGTIRTVAGNGVGLFGGDGGRAIDAEFRSPQGVAVDARHNLYVTDAWNQRIRLIAPSGTVWTIAGSGQFGFSGDGGPAENARLAGSFGLAVDSQGCVYIADTLNHRIRKLTPLNPN